MSTTRADQHARRADEKRPGSSTTDSPRAPGSTGRRRVVRRRRHVRSVVGNPEAAPYIDVFDLIPASRSSCASFTTSPRPLHRLER